MPNQNAPPKVAAPQSEAPAIKNDRALGEIRSQIIREYIASGQPTLEKNWLYSRLIEARVALLSAERQRRELRESLSKVIRLERLMSGDSERDEECYKALLDAEAEAEALLEGGK